MLTILCSAENSLVTSCEGSTKYGPIIHVDFHKINRPCTCIVTPLFFGELIVMSRKVVYACNAQVNVQNTFIFGCPSHLSSQTISVTMNQSLDVRAEYVSLYTSGTFYHCLGFQQNGTIVSFSIVLKIINIVSCRHYVILYCHITDSYQCLLEVAYLSLQDAFAYYIFILKKNKYFYHMS